MDYYPQESDYRRQRAIWLRNHFHEAPKDARVPVADVKDVLKSLTSNNTEIGLIVRMAFPAVERKKRKKVYYYYGMQRLPTSDRDIVPNSCSDDSSDVGLEKLKFLSTMPSSDLAPVPVSEQEISEEYGYKRNADYLPFILNVTHAVFLNLTDQFEVNKAEKMILMFGGHIEQC